MKKLLLSLGTIATIAAPLAAVVSCGNNEGSQNHKYSNDPDEALFQQASEQTETEHTVHDYIAIGGPGLKTWKDGVVPLLKFNIAADFNHTFAEFRAGDYIDFIFDDANDIKTFTKRVFYDNTLSEKNNIDIKNAHFDDIHYSPYEVKNDKVVAKPEYTGKFVTEGVDGLNSIFTLSAIKKNVIRMTFNDIYTSVKNHLDAQIIYLKGFEDRNGDGKTDLDDKSMTPTFTIDGGEMYTNYVQTYTLKNKMYWFPDWTVGVHDKTIADYVEARYENPRLDYEVPKVYPDKFDASKIQWAATVDTSSLKEGDILEVMWDGAKNIAKVVKDGSILKLVLTNGHDFRDMYGVTSKDATHISAYNKPEMMGAPVKVKDYEITRMGLLS